MNNVPFTSPFLRVSRSFPEEISELSQVLNKTYIDIANVVNFRMIGIFPTTSPVNSGENWYLSKNQKQQSFRKVYNLPSLSSFNHNLDLKKISTFTTIRGIYTDGSNYYPLPYVGPPDISISVSPTQIVIVPQVGVPVFSSGFVLLEWLSFV